VPQEYAVSNAPRVSLNPLSDEYQAMRGRGEGGNAHELTGSNMQASQKSLVGLALERDGRGELEFSVLWKERSEAFCSKFARQRQRQRQRERKWSTRPNLLGQPALPTGKTTVPYATTGSSTDTEWPSEFSQQWVPSIK